MKNEHEDWKAGPRVEELGYEKNRKYSQSFGSESVCSLSMTTSRIEMARKMATAPKGEIFHVSNFIHSQRFRVSSLPPSLPPFLSLSLSLSLSFAFCRFFSHAVARTKMCSWGGEMYVSVRSKAFVIQGNRFLVQ